MVNNFERILEEIKIEAGRTAQDYNLEPEVVVKLIMDIVDLQDQHRIKAVAGINQKIKQLIQNEVQSSNSMKGA